MEKYYSLNWKDGKEPLASAFAPEDSKNGHELIKELAGAYMLPFELTLVKLSVGKNGLIKNNNLSDLKKVWLDYQPNNLAWPLMSERMKSLIEVNLTGKEGVDWIACKVKNGDEERPYFIIRFNTMLDVLDMHKTMFVRETGYVIRPVFDASKIISYNIFTKPSLYDLWKITSGLYVSETLKKAILKEKLTGIEFEKTSVE